MAALWGLFVSAFLAATILPFYSEVVLGVLVLDGHDPWTLWFVASLGNTVSRIVTPSTTL